MTKQLYSLRLEGNVITALHELANIKGITSAELVRMKINELVNGDVYPETLTRVKNIIKELKGPFVYVKNPKGVVFKTNERGIRNQLIKKLKEAFNLK